MKLSAGEGRQLRAALAEAPDELKQHFRRCWPSVKRLLEWAKGRLPGVLQWLVAMAVRTGDWVYKALECEENGKGEGEL